MNQYIKESVNRFLGWKLPADFAPDAGITFKPSDHPLCGPVGTNLFTAQQATAMLTHVAKPLIDRITELEAQLAAVNQKYLQLTAQTCRAEDLAESLQMQLASVQKDAELMPLLKDARRELHACQAVIYLAGGFDPAYVSDAQKVLKAIDAAIAGEAT